MTDVSNSSFLITKEKVKTLTFLFIVSRCLFWEVFSLQLYMHSLSIIYSQHAELFQPPFSLFKSYCFKGHFAIDN